MQDPKTPSNPAAAPAEPNNPKTKKKTRTPAQSAAARKNGAKSKGPKTPAGRAKCAYSASSQFKHAHLSGTVLIPGECHKTFKALLDSYISALKPASEPEHNAIQQMVVAYWQKLRIWQTHATTFTCEFARQDPSLPYSVRVAEAERAGSLGQPETSQLDRQLHNAIRSFRLLRQLRTLSSPNDTVPLPLSLVLSDESETSQN